MSNKIASKLAIGIILVLVGIGLYFGYKKVEANKIEESDIELKEDNQKKEESIVEIIDENENKTLESETKKEMLEDENEDDETVVVNNQEKTSILPIPLKKNIDKDVLKIGFMTDLHVRSQNGGGFLLEDFYTKRINYFVEKMNNIFIPNFIILNGDIIEGTKTSSNIGMRELSLVKKLFDRTTLKKYWVIGNHDLRSINKDQWKETLGIDYTTKSFNVGNYKIIILDSNFTKDDKNVSPDKDDYDRGKVSERRMTWLRNEIKKTSKKVVVFMHHPPLRNIKAKNDVDLLYNANELQDLFSKYEVLLVCLGHIEDLYYKEIGEVNYFVSPGIVKYPKYSGAFSEITIKGKKIDIKLNYRNANGIYNIIDVDN